MSQISDSAGFLIKELKLKCNWIHSTLSQTSTHSPTHTHTLGLAVKFVCGISQRLKIGFQPARFSCDSCWSESIYLTEAGAGPEAGALNGKGKPTPSNALRCTRDSVARLMNNLPFLVVYADRWEALQVMLRKMQSRPTGELRNQALSDKMWFLQLPFNFCLHHRVTLWTKFNTAGLSVR